VPQSHLSQGGHLELATSYSSEAWFPCCPAVLERVRKGITNGQFEADPEPLLAELKADFSLLFFLLQCIAQRMPGENRSPREMIVGSLQRGILKEIIASPDFRVGRHHLSSMSPSQGSQLHAAMISASAAEELAAAAGIDPFEGFSCALLRQLGLTLISWNYPHVYSRAVAYVTPARTVDRTISSLLGFSPTLLAVRVCEKWGLSNSLRGALGDSSAVIVKGSEEEHVVQLLCKICQVGEALSRVTNPEQTGTNEADWNFARAEVESTLGAEGISRIRRRIVENCARYAEINPGLFPTQETETKGSESSRPANATRNLYLHHCPERVQVILNGLYATIERASITKESLDLLCKHAAPEAGFARGVIYLLDPEDNLLIPRLPIGETRLMDFAPVPVSAQQNQDFVRAAFLARTTLSEEKTLADGRRILTLAGALGVEQRIGVLLLESGPLAASGVQSTPLIYFKALKQAMDDCMGLY